jgi:hypothetical protein
MPYGRFVGPRYYIRMVTLAETRPGEGMWKDKVKRAWIAAAKLGWHLWREAVAVDDQDWPPFWLYAAGAIITVIVLINVGSFAITSLLSSVGASAGSSHWGLVVEAPLRGYVDQHSRGLPVSSAALINVWGLTGLILFVFSFFGSFGARIGWIVFGLFSCAAVYAGTLPPAQWTAAAVAAFAWSGASIFALHSVDRYRSCSKDGTSTRHGRVTVRTRKEEADRRFEEVRKHALQSAKRQGYRDLDEYFGERGNQIIATIARELMISKTKVNPLREEYLEAGISRRGTLTPRKQREIIADVRSGNYSNSRICKKHGCSQEVVRRIRTWVDASAAEKRTVREDAPSSLPASLLPDSEQVGDE